MKMVNGRHLGAVLIRPPNTLVSPQKEILICRSDWFVIMGSFLVKSIYSTKRIVFPHKRDILSDVL